MNYCIMHQQESAAAVEREGEREREREMNFERKH